jgi:hypothetical protein
MIFPVVTLMTDKRLDCGDSWLMSLVFGLGVGLSSAFLGGYAAAHGDIKIPFLGENPLTAGIAGGVAFLVVGAGVAYLLASSSCVNPQQRFVRPFFGEWYYSRDAKTISFRLERETFIPAASYVPEPKSDSYDVYVAARAKGESDPWTGTYQIVSGPFKYSTGSLIEKRLTDQELSTLGDCVQLIAFGMKAGQRAAVPFSPEIDQVQRFQWAGVCRKDRR